MKGKRRWASEEPRPYDRRSTGCELRFEGRPNNGRPSEARGWIMVNQATDSGYLLIHRRQLWVGESTGLRRLCGARVDRVVIKPAFEPASRWGVLLVAKLGLRNRDSARRISHTEFRQMSGQRAA